MDEVLVYIRVFLKDEMKGLNTLTHVAWVC